MDEFSSKVVQIAFSEWGKFTPVIKSEECCYNMVKDIVIFADASNFMLTLDGTGAFLQNFKNRELLKIEKGLIHPMEGIIKRFS